MADVKTVEDMMVPLSEYATVSEDATMSEAVAALKEAQDAFGKDRYRHRAILIFDSRDRQKIVGKISQIDILRALEPKYDEMIAPPKRSFNLGFTRNFQKQMLEQLKLWDAAMHDICRKAAEKKVKTFMKTPDEGEFVESNVSINEAIHQIVLGHHQSLLVTEPSGRRIVGVLRLTDVFEFIAQAVAACKI